MVIGESPLTRKNQDRQSSPTAYEIPAKNRAHKEWKGNKHFTSREILPNFLVAWKFNRILEPWKLHFPQKAMWIVMLY